MSKTINLYIGRTLIYVATCSLLGGMAIGGLLSKLIPEPVATKPFAVPNTNHVGQLVQRIIGNDEIIMYDSEQRKFIPLESYLKKIPEEYGQKNLAENMIRNYLKKQEKGTNKIKTYKIPKEDLEKYSKFNQL